MYSRKSIERKCLAKGWFTSDPSLIQGAYVFSYLTTLKMMENKKFYFKINPPSLQKKKNWMLHTNMTIGIRIPCINRLTDRPMYRLSPSITLYNPSPYPCASLSPVSPPPIVYTHTQACTNVCECVFFLDKEKLSDQLSSLLVRTRARTSDA